MKKRRFRSELRTGHKGAAVFVPFDPAEVWKVRSTRVASSAYGVRPGFLVRGTMNGQAFEGWIGHRWGRFFILVDETLRRRIGAAPGDAVTVAVEPRPVDPPAARAPRRRAKSKSISPSRKAGTRRA